MKILEDKIRQDGVVLPGNILKVDSFLNHQIDPGFIRMIAAEFGRIFYGKGINKILTVEASGIAIAYATSQYFHDCPVVYAKKGSVSTMSKEVYSSKIHSYTHNDDYKLNVSTKYLFSEDKVLLIDDFLAMGEALNGLLDICQQAGCEVIGCGVAVEKAFQGGGDQIRSRGINVVSLARVRKMTDDGEIEFCE